MKREELEDLQLKKLRKMVDYCYNNIPFYHQKLGAAGITSGDKIKTRSDIRYIPVTTKDDIRDNYPKYILRTDAFADGNYEGIKTMHIADFLLSDEY